MYTKQATAPSVAALAALALITAAACDSTVTGGGGSEGGAGGTAGSANAAGGASDQGDGGAGGSPATTGDSTVASTTTGSGSVGAANCTLQKLTVTPSDNSPTDGCDAIYTCDNGVVVTVECDGENDGTYTSLCSCYIGSTWADGGLVEGEGEAACPAGFSNCMQ